MDGKRFTVRVHTPVHNYIRKQVTEEQLQRAEEAKSAQNFPMDLIIGHDESGEPLKFSQPFTRIERLD